MNDHEVDVVGSGCMGILLGLAIAAGVLWWCL